MEGAAAMTIAQMFSTVGTLVSSAIEWAGDYLTMITSNDVLVVFCIALPMVGLGIGIIKRIVSVRA